MKCPHCGAELPVHAALCPSCGQRVGSAMPADAPDVDGETVLMDMPGEDAEPAAPEGVAEPAPDQGETQLMDQAETPSADQGETQLLDDGETQLMDHGETRLMDDAKTHLMPSKPVIPTVAFPDDTMSAPAPIIDGLDALDDPYAPLVTGSELTNISPTPIKSPVSPEFDGTAKKRRWPFVLGIIVAVALVGFGIYYTWQQELWGGKTIPDVTGQAQDAATQTLQSAGFTVSVITKASDDGIGTVLSTDPAAGTRVDPTSGVTLTVAVARTIPSVVGLTVDKAEQALYDAGATNISVTYQASSQAEGTVVSVSPDVDATFVSTDAITLVVAQAFTVPDVTGKSLSDAQAAITSAGYVAKVSYVDSDSAADVVISTDPAAGTKLDQGSTVTLSVPNPYPSDYYHLLDFLTCTPAQDAAYLVQEGFSTVTARKLTNGDAFGVYQKGNDVLMVTDTPETGTFDIMSSSYDALANGCAVGGLRLRLDPSALSAEQTDVSDAGVQAIMTLCGFSGLTSSCTEADFASTPTVASSGAHFICAYGEQDSYVWTVLIGGYQGSLKVVATVGTKSHYSSVDLSTYDNSICKYVAYSTLFAG